MNTLIKGIGNREDGKLCVMSLTALIAGEEHTDTPVCASPVLTIAAIRLNDGLWWASDEERTAVLTPLAHEMVGTRNRALEARRTELFIRAAFAVWAPRILDATGQPNLIALAQELRAVDPIGDQVKAVSIARAAGNAAYDYSYIAGDAAVYAADAAVDYTATRHVAANAANAGDAAVYAADAAAYYAAAYDDDDGDTEDDHVYAGAGVDQATHAAYIVAHGLHDSEANAKAIIIRGELLALIREGIALS